MPSNGNGSKSLKTAKRPTRIVPLDYNNLPAFALTQDRDLTLGWAERDLELVYMNGKGAAEIRPYTSLVALHQDVGRLLPSSNLRDIYDISSRVMEGFERKAPHDKIEIPVVVAKDMGGNSIELLANRMLVAYFPVEGKPLPQAEYSNGPSI